MKQLVLGALMIGATNIATGCIFVSDDDDGGGGGSGIGDISLAWTTDPGCPPGATTAEAIAIRDDGEEFTDLFDCEAGVGEIADLAEGTYDVHINITSEDGNTLFAQSFVEVGVVVIEDTVVDVDEFLILTEEAFFTFDWEITEAGEPIDCDFIPRDNAPCDIEDDPACDGITNGFCDVDAGVCRGDGEGISIIPTFLDDTELVLDEEYPCAQSGVVDLTEPMPLGDYTIVFDVFVDDGAGPASVLDSEPIDASLVVGNEVEDLGTVLFDF
jgi:hypothetical protein